MKANAILKVDDVNSNEIKKSLPNVNPLYVPKYNEDINSSEAVKVKTACQALNALTTNTFKALDLEITADITDASSKTEPTISVSSGIMYDNEWFDSVDSITKGFTVESNWITNQTTLAKFTTNSSGAISMKVLASSSANFTFEYSAGGGLKCTNYEPTQKNSAIIGITIAETSTYAERTIYAMFMA